MEITASISPRKFAEMETTLVEEKARALIKGDTGIIDIWHYKKTPDYRSYCFGDGGDSEDSISPYWIIMSTLLCIIAGILLYIFADMPLWFAIICLPLSSIIEGGLLFFIVALVQKAGRAASIIALFWIPMLLSLVVRVVFGTITYPLHALLCRSWNKSYQAKITQLRATADARVAGYNAAFEEQAKAKAPIYSGHEVTEMLCEKIKGVFADQKIKYEPRHSSIKSICVSYQFYLSSNGVTIGCDSFEFEKYRCKSLPDDLSVMAYGYALADGVIARIRAEYPKDPSGTDYKIDKSCSFNENGEAIITLTYSAKNGNHDKLYDWGVTTP